MRKLLTSRAFRCALCLILVLVLLISWSPIRVQASVLVGTAVLFGDDAIAILLAVLGGLGVFAVADSEISDLDARSLARSAMDAMEEAGTFVKNGALTVYTNVSEAWSYAVSTDLVQWLHDWLFSSGTLDSPVFHTSLSAVLKSGEVSTFTCSEPFTMGYFYCTIYSSYYAFAFTAKQAKISFGGSTLSTHIVHPNGYFSWTYADESCTLPYYGTTSLTYQDFIRSLNLSAGTVTTQQALTLGTVAPPGTDIETEYGEYIVIVAPNGVPDSGGDGGDDEQPKIPVLPVPYLPPNEIPNVPQKDIWKGNKVEIENPDSGDTPDPTTGTDTDDPDSGSNDPTTPTTGTDNPDSPGDDGSQDVPLTPDQLQPFVVDLRDFFPFCIPFDLYDFFQLLDVDPVAPVFHWEIQDLAGNVYSIDIDLSAWDSTALFFRRLQLLVFTVGLAMASRKFIKW